jgi:hypothetical protein
MTHHVWSLRTLGKSTGREPPIVFPTEFVDSRDDDRLSSIRGVVWCVVCEAAICIVVAVGWGLWLCFR